MTLFFNIIHFSHAEARNRINDEFKKNKSETDPEKIKGVSIYNHKKDLRKEWCYVDKIWVPSYKETNKGELIDH